MAAAHHADIRPMKSLRTAPRPSLALIVSLVALAFSVAGTAYAVSSINGGLIKKNSIPANRIKKHALTATQLNLKALGTIPRATAAVTANSAITAQSAVSAVSAQTAASAHNADLLGGIAATGFVQGAGTSLSKAVTVTSTTAVTLATIAGVGQLQADCTPSMSVDLYYVNTTGAPADVAVWTWLIGPPTPYAFRPAPIAANTSVYLNSTSGSLTINGGTSAGTVDLTLTGDVAGDGTCHVYLTGATTLAVS
jgi:hypothetical protein